MIGQDSLLPPRQAILEEQAHPMAGQDSLLAPRHAVLEELAHPMIGKDYLLDWEALLVAGMAAAPFP